MTIEPKYRYGKFRGYMYNKYRFCEMCRMKWMENIKHRKPGGNLPGPFLFETTLGGLCSYCVIELEQTMPEFALGLGRCPEDM